MAHSITVPQFGQTVEEATLVRWQCSEGDTVAKGDILFEIETDKAVLDVESFFDGVLLKVFVQEGETVPVQTVACFIGEPGEKVPDAPPPPVPVVKAVDDASAPAGYPKTAVREAGSHAAKVSAQVVQHADDPATELKRFRISPRAARLARERVIDPTRIIGSGPDGRVVEQDVLTYLENSGYDRLEVTPTAKALASKEDIDLLAVQGTGRDGKITKEDIEGALAEKPKPMSKIRRIIAERLTGSYQSVPHFFVTVSVDLTDLLALRKEKKKGGQTYSVTDFFLKACALALEKFPDVNSTTDGRTSTWHRNINLGLAVAIEEGLVVPVLRCAEDLTLKEIHDGAAELIKKARAGKLRPDQMTGSTFTISNMGMLNVENFTAIINPGESAILALSSPIETPVVRKGEVVVRTMMKITMSSDHRIIDGVMAAKFINTIKRKLEDTAYWQKEA